MNVIDSVPARNLEFVNPNIKQKKKYIFAYHSKENVSI